MERSVFLWIILLYCFLCFLGFTVAKPVEPNDSPCDRYLYCQGEKFPSVFEVEGWEVKCDSVPITAQQCCLPQAKHMVCYNIKVQGHTLNFNEKATNETTDFAQYCDMLLKSQGKTPAKYSSIVTGAKGGLLYFQNNKHAGTAEKEEAKHIKHLACSFQD